MRRSSSEHCECVFAYGTNFVCFGVYRDNGRLTQYNALVFNIDKHRRSAQVYTYIIIEHISAPKLTKSDYTQNAYSHILLLYRIIRFNSTYFQKFFRIFVKNIVTIFL